MCTKAKHKKHLRKNDDREKTNCTADMGGRLGGGEQRDWCVFPVSAAAVAIR